MLHIHGNVVDSEESSWTKYVSESVGETARSQGIDSEITWTKYVSESITISSLGGVTYVCLQVIAGKFL